MYQKIIEIEGKNLLCSLNNKYINKNFCLSSKYREIKNNIEAHSKMVNVNPPYTMLIEVHTRKDIDNFIKPLFDSLQSKFGNDNQILRMFVDKIKITKKNIPEKLVIYVSTKNNYSFIDLLKMGIL